MNGILLIDKPAGWTSFDVVNYVRKIVATYENKKPLQVKVGHTGTLDPLATGLLVLLLGDRTKKAPELAKLEKTYQATMLLGHESSTGDEEGVKTFISDRQPDLAEIKAVFEVFTGEITQTPPAFSAIKVNGRRAYAMARAGEKVELEPRPATIHELKLEDYAYPNVRFVTRVSSGTYVRTLVEDMGGELGTGAYMSQLRRTHVGDYDISAAIAVDGLTPLEIQQHLLA